MANAAANAANTRCPHCGVSLALTGRAHRCSVDKDVLRTFTGHRIGPLDVVVANAHRGSKKSKAAPREDGRVEKVSVLRDDAPSYARYVDPAGRRAYMRDYMKARRKAEREKRA